MPLSRDPAKRRNQLANLRPAPRAPFGNRRHLTHGAYGTLAADRLDAKVAEVFAALAEDVPVRADDGSLPAPDAPARLLADALCRLDSIGEYLGRRGWQDDDGRPRPVLDYEARLRGHALDLMRELGLTPAARAKLGLDLAKLATPAERLSSHLDGRYGS